MVGCNAGIGKDAKHWLGVASIFFLNRGRSNMSSSTDYVCEMVV